MNNLDLNNRLLEAASAGRIDEFRSLVKQGAQIDFRDDDGCDASLRAVVGGHLEFYDVLMDEYGFDTKSKDKFGNSASILAAIFGHTEMFDQLISKYQHQVNEVNNFNENALMMAIGNSSLRSVQHLLFNHPVNLRQKNADGNTALEIADRHNQVEISDRIKSAIYQLSHLIKIEIYQWQEGLKKVKDLYERGGEFDLNGVSEVSHLAVASNNVELYDYLVEELGFEVTEYNFQQAAFPGRGKMLNHLLTKHLNKIPYELLERVRINRAACGNEEIVERINQAQNDLIDLEEVLQCISSNSEDRIWKESKYQTPKIYYGFTKPYYMPIRNKTSFELSEESKEFIRKVIRDNAGDINIEIEEIPVSEEQRINISLGRTSLDKRRMIFIEADPTLTFDNQVHGYVRKSVTPRVQTIMFSDELLLDESLPDRSTYVVLHEFFGHAIGSLKHPNKYAQHDLEPFGSKKINADHSVMAYGSPASQDCNAKLQAARQGGICPEDYKVPEEISRKYCLNKYPTKLTKTDIEAINLHIAKSYSVEGMGGVRDSSNVCQDDKVVYEENSAVEIKREDMLTVDFLGRNNTQLQDSDRLFDKNQELRPAASVVATRDNSGTVPNQI